MVRSRTLAALGAAVVTGALLGAPGVQATTNWDMPLAWPQGNFHVKNAQRFADEVEKATGGEVVITLHPGGALGFKGPEMLRTVRDGLVPIGDVLINQQTGEVALFGMESLPYLASGQKETRELLEHARPVYDEVAEQYNQKILYIVPWPGQGLYSSDPVVKLEDMQGLKMRVVDKNGLDFFSALGAAPRQLPWGEVVPALASGAIEGVTTSSSSGVDGKFWEFLCCLNRFNWQSSSNMVTVNLDAWNALSEEHRAAIEKVAAELEPVFWEVSREEDEQKLKTLEENGMKVTEPTPELRAKLIEAAKPLWKDFAEKAGPKAAEVMEAYRAASGK
ncbi:TRAP transporter substrate-binding protein [Marinimicrococcus flavescens]|uniref:TRAP transporter substrate-binding protein n=1 Tax=Marinimicrococcus flavescens TaxID=3031815 RepID=A0AAP3V1S4_9PROT|nr:TRAP transporter substrate-binding protein [Marinimicrococcus flavescens]